MTENFLQLSEDKTEVKSYQPSVISDFKVIFNLHVKHVVNIGFIILRV